MKNLKNKIYINQLYVMKSLNKKVKRAVIGLWVLPVGLHYWAVQGSTHQDDVLRSVWMTTSRGRETARDCRPEKEKDSLRS
jgi:hypothetical protein